MAFRNGCYASIWGCYPNESGKATSVRVSISKKNKTTQQYETDFSGFVTFIGDANSKIQRYVGKQIGDNRRPLARIRLDEISATRKERPGQEGVPAKEKVYIDGFQCYAFTDEDELNEGNAPVQSSKPSSYDPSIPDDAGDDEELPFS